MSKVLVIAGGQWQVPLINFLKQRNYEVYVVDPYETSPGVALADFQIKCDVRDANEIMRQIKGINFEFITTDQSDISVESVAIVSNQLQLPGNSVDVVRLFSNKFLSRKFACSIGVPTPAFREVRNVAEIEAFCKGHDQYFILKPVDSQSSRGIHKLSGKELSNIQDLFVETLSTSMQDYALIEEFVEGVEITVEGICSNYKHKSIASSSKTHFRTGIASSLKYPADIPDELLQEVLKCNDKYVNASGLKFGITHAEYIVDVKNNRFWLVEIACRGGGTLISSDIAKWVSGVNLYEILLKSLQGQIVDVEHLKPLRRNAILYFFEFAPGKVKEISGLEKAREIPGVLDIQLLFKAGDTIKLASDDRSRQGFTIVFANSIDELNNTLQEIKEKIQISYEHE